MKNLIFLFLGLFIFSSCVKDTDTLTKHDETSTKTETILIQAKRFPAITLCHSDKDGNSFLRKIDSNNEKAILFHLNHGDVILEDLDGDGYFSYESKCEPSVDCDDLDPFVNPGMQEIDGDGIDNNCDGKKEEGEDPGNKSSCPCFEMEDLLASPIAYYLDSERDSDCYNEKGIGLIPKGEEFELLVWLSYESLICYSNATLEEAIALKGDEPLACQQALREVIELFGASEFCNSED